MATITELLEAHYDAAWNYRGRRECACRYEFTGGYSASLHRGHVAAVLEQHMQEREAEAWDLGAATAWQRSTPTVNGTNHFWRTAGEPVNPHRKESTDD